MTTGLFLFLNIGTSEMMLILFAALFLFGGKKLPELARGLGRGIREFKDASETIKRDISDQINSFEDGLDTVKTDIKSITQGTIEEEVSTPKDDSTVPSVPANTDHQNDISHSDQYYKNYDYNYPEEPKADTELTKVAPDASQAEGSITEENGKSNS